MELKIENLTKNYGKKCALDHFTFTFGCGVYGILGANGAGKTTLMSLITDTLKRDDGSILYDGEEILKMGADFRSLVGYMPQEQGFYEKMSVKSFLFYMAELKGLSRREAKEQIPKLLEVVNLKNCGHMHMESLSGGMRQRALLAQALLGTPTVVILDEPTAGLDPWERKRLCRYIWTLGEKAIVFLTSHIVSDIEDTADYILIMKNGHIIEDGYPDELVEKSGKANLEELFLAVLDRKNVEYSDKENNDKYNNCNHNGNCHGNHNSNYNNDYDGDYSDGNHDRS